MPEEEPTPFPYDSKENQSLKLWLHSLKDHDIADTRGLLEGLSAVLQLLAARTPSSTPHGCTVRDA